jgi:hypothetical protein
MAKTEEPTVFVSLAITEPEYNLFKAASTEPLDFILKTALAIVKENKTVIEKLIEKLLKTALISEEEYRRLKRIFKEVQEGK